MSSPCLFQVFVSIGTLESDLLSQSIPQVDIILVTVHRTDTPIQYGANILLQKDNRCLFYTVTLLAA